MVLLSQAWSVPGKDGVWRHQVPGGPLVLLMPDHGVKVVAAAQAGRAGWAARRRSDGGKSQLWHRLYKQYRHAVEAVALGEGLLQLRGSTRAQIDLDALPSRVSGRALRDEEALPFFDGLNQNEPSEAELERASSAGGRSAAKTKGFSRRCATQDPAFGSHPYKLEPSFQSLSGLSRKRPLEPWRRAASLAQMTLAIVGDF